MGRPPRTPLSRKEKEKNIVCAGFEFFSKFDSANIDRVEHVPPKETYRRARSVDLEAPDVEFNIWTKPDCVGTEFENKHRTWFYFGMRANTPGLLVKLNMIDLSKLEKVHSVGMAPVFRIVPDQMEWERVPDKPTFEIYNPRCCRRAKTETPIYKMSFKYKTPDNIKSISYLAFTYPFSYMEHINMLKNIDSRFVKFAPTSRDDIYYTREPVCFSLEGRRIDLLTISSYHNICSRRETRLKNLFPDQHVRRPFTFFKKKVIFISARVHPGETPSSFVFNGLLNLLLNRYDPVGIALRKLYVFKLIPILNPDGVAKGHHRSDTRGLDLNRMYLNPSLDLHPSIYAARALIRLYHYGYEKEDEDNVSSVGDSCQSATDNNKSSKKISRRTPEKNKKSRSEIKLCKQVSSMTSKQNNRNQSESWWNKYKPSIKKLADIVPGISNIISTFNRSNSLSSGEGMCQKPSSGNKTPSIEVIIKNEEANWQDEKSNSDESGLFMYMDLHSHFSKNGIFIYGNRFEYLEDNIECMILPKIMSINNQNFHFYGCNFTERNMYVRDRRDGVMKGAGRVAVLKLTGIIRSYTLECNHNTGKYVNDLPRSIGEADAETTRRFSMPPKYTPEIFEEIGTALGASILDLTGHNPISRLPNSQFRTLDGIRKWLRDHCCHGLAESRCRFELKPATSRYSEGKSAGALAVNTSPTSGPVLTFNKNVQTMNVPTEGQNNISDTGGNLVSQTSCSTMVLPKTKPKSASDIRTNIRKESISKLKAATWHEKVKSNTAIPLLQRVSSGPSQTPLVGVRSKLYTIEENPPESDDSSGITLYEIYFIKNSKEKRIIAKYKSKEDNNESGEDNLIVAWDIAHRGHVFLLKTKEPGIQNLRPLSDGAAPRRMGAFRVHSFHRPSVVQLDTT